MITSRTVFIVGAGASSEAGLPVGNTLKREISQKLNIRFEDFDRQVSGDPVIYHVLRQTYGQSINQMLDACGSISEGLILANSIDDYIDVHQDNPAIAICGKLAIAKCILEAERTSRLFFERERLDSTIDFSKLENTWYAPFYVLLTQQVKRLELEAIFDNVTIVTFNYDRCIEHFLVYAIAMTYWLTIDEARALVAKLKIFHVYGSVGKYFGAPHEVVDFGHRGVPTVESVTRNLRTYCERIDDDQTMTDMHLAISNASRIVFLGTAFHKLNMELITPKPHGVGKVTFATCKGFNKEEDLLVVGQRYLSKISGVPVVNGLKASGYRFSTECRDLFADYHVSLRD